MATTPTNATENTGSEGAGTPVRPVKLFIGGLTRNTTTKMLREHFAKYGRILDCVAMCQPDGRPRGFGYVTLDSPIVADRCLAEAQVIDGRCVDMKKAIPGSNREKGATDAQTTAGGSSASTTASFGFPSGPSAAGGNSVGGLGALGNAVPGPLGGLAGGGLGALGGLGGGVGLGVGGVGGHPFLQTPSFGLPQAAAGGHPSYPLYPGLVSQPHPHFPNTTTTMAAASGFGLEGLGAYPHSLALHQDPIFSAMGVGSEYQTSSPTPLTPSAFGKFDPSLDCLEVLRRAHPPTPGSSDASSRRSALCLDAVISKPHMSAAAREFVPNLPSQQPSYLQLQENRAQQESEQQQQKQQENNNNSNNNSNQQKQLQLQQQQTKKKSILSSPKKITLLSEKSEKSQLDRARSILGDITNLDESDAVKLPFRVDSTLRGASRSTMKPSSMEIFTDLSPSEEASTSSAKENLPAPPPGLGAPPGLEADSTFRPTPPPGLGSASSQNPREWLPIPSQTANLERFGLSAR